MIGYNTAKRSLQRILSFSDPLKRAKILQFGLKFVGGAILHGPPGNSKTRLIAAAASSYGLSVISLSAADVYSPYVGMCTLLYAYVYPPVHATDVVLSFICVSCL